MQFGKIICIRSSVIVIEKNEKITAYQRHVLRGAHNVLKLRALGI